MKVSSLALAATVVLATSHTSSAFEVWGFRAVNHNGVDPSRNGQELEFTIHDKQCSKRGYGDGRDENDCKGGNVTSYMIKAFHAKPGDTFDYHLEVNVGDNLEYRGFDNNGRWDSRLRMFAFLRDKPRNHIYEMKLNSKQGATFMGAKCFSPAQFGSWNAIDMRIKWAADATGKIEVKCNGSVVYEAVNVVTALSPDCIVTNHCDPAAQDLDGKIHFSFGLRMDGFGHEWRQYGQPSQFTDIQPDGITATYRNVVVKRVKE